MSCTERLIRMKVDQLVSGMFPELNNNEAVRKEVMEVLVWRDIRLKRFEDFVMVLEQMGGIQIFVNYE